MARGRSANRSRRPRTAEALVLFVCGSVLVQAFALEPFQVPTGSMAPALLGHHRECVCPHCGMTVKIGRPRCDPDGQGDARFYSKAYCPNCGAMPIPAGEAPETAGDHVLVNKTAFAFRRPRRWEVVVIRLFGRIFIKRIIGLPGESLVIDDGDIYVDDRLVRKSFDQAKAMSVLVFDQTSRPPEGWGDRWERRPAAATEEGSDLLLDGRYTPQTLTYRHGPAVAGKSPPIRDEYAYNDGLVAGAEQVHDFRVETEVEVLAGQGTFKLRLFDGQDWVEAVVPVAAGARHRIEMAFVDRRLNARVDGRRLIEDVDFPPPGPRPGVTRPAQLEADGAAIAIRGFRLYRDVHYTRQGRHGVGGEPVLLGVEQYFVLGDNSPNSEDSRFWPPEAVSQSQLLGSAFLVHLPSRPIGWQCAGWSGLYQLPDFGRIRWIR